MRIKKKKKKKRYMLYGDQSLTFETSKRLLEATLTFIHATERFKTISVLTIPYIGTYPYFLFSKSRGVVASRIELDDTICSWGSPFHVGYNPTNNLKHFFFYILIIITWTITIQSQREHGNT